MQHIASIGCSVSLLRPASFLSSDDCGSTHLGFFVFNLDSHKVIPYFDDPQIKAPVNSCILLVEPILMDGAEFSVEELSQQVTTT